MSISIELLKSKSQIILKKRAHVKEKLEIFEKSLAETFADLPIAASSKDIKLDFITPDDYIYGHLFFKYGELSVCSRSTEKDLEEAFDGYGTEKSFSVKSLFECSSEWLNKFGASPLNP